MNNLPANKDAYDEGMALLKRLERKGVRHVYDLDKDETKQPETRDTAPVASARTESTSMPKTKPADDAATVKALDKLAAEIATCELCALHEGRTNTVFGTGSYNTKVMFIGEAPGKDEDLQGEPFVGRSGQLLTKILAAMELRREDVYIGNILKCRPPGNRDPQESEVRCCENYLKKQIALIKPNYICALGRVSAQWLLQTKATLGEMRAGDYEYEGIPVIATYHPAALLRNPNFKKPCWEDMKKLKALMDAC